MAHFNRIMANFDQFSGDLKDISTVNKDAITEIVRNVRASSAQLEATIGTIRRLAEKIEQGEGSLGKLVNDPETADNLNATLASLRNISDRIDRGEGSLGKLVTDEETVDRLNDALGGLNRFVSRRERFKTFLEYRGEYLADRQDVKSFVTLRLQPRPDKYYLLGIVADPIGREETTDRTFTVTDAAGTRTRTEREVEREEDEFEFSAQIAKRFYDLVLRGGIIESSGGFGLEYYLYDDTLQFTFEAFDFDADENPHLKFYADYTFLNHLYLTAGVDDFISETGDETFFVGAGLRFMDDDLRTLLTNINVTTSTD
jgi:phospholipid/cholesterol/gamma-HCH transport system substrate-binding protein